MRHAERIAAGGAEDFYEGETARRIGGGDGGARRSDHGRRSEELSKVERKPLEGDYSGFHIITAPPPSAGGVGLLQMLGMLDGTGYAEDGADSVQAIHYEAEAMRRFYADRSEYLGDPEFYNVPVKQLLDPKYIAWRRGTHRSDARDTERCGDARPAATR